MSSDADLLRLGLFINNAWSPASSGATYRSQDPFSGTDWAEVPDAGPADVDRGGQRREGCPERTVGRDDRA